MAVRSSDVLIILIAILLPPAAVGIQTGCSCDLLINILLTLLGYIPGCVTCDRSAARALFADLPPLLPPRFSQFLSHIHAFWLIWKRIKAEEAYGYNGFQYKGNGEYVRNPNAPPPAVAPPSYGSTV
ncbi:hypothetical protein CF326_g2458 [Tilletia indica]|nr:hypothetical protein CF326_g2458 [Tilletia indica]